MQTQSHLLLTAAAFTTLRKRSGALFAVTAAALLLGSILPDIPLFLLTIAGEIYYRWLAPLPPAPSIMEYVHFTLFFSDPLWIAGHNFFHSVVIDVILLLIGLWGWRRRGSRCRLALFWLAVSMLAHVTIDIFTHRSDGPLIWFPLNWDYRFASPVSYWEADYGGRIFAPFELALNVALIGYLLVAYWPTLRRRWWWLRGKGQA